MNSTRSFSIVLAEDCKQDVFLIHHALEKVELHYDLQEFVDGEQVIRYLDRVDKDESLPCPDLIVLDLNMPKRSGEEVFARLRAVQRCSKTAVLVITSSDAPADRARAAELGAAAFFRKPMDLDEFLTIGTLIRDILANEGSRDASV